MQAHLERELSFFHTGVSIDSERDRVEHALGKAGLRVVSEVRGPSFVALGATDGRFAHTAIRVITKRGVVTGDDASRNDLFHPGRVHLLQDAPVRTGPLSLVAWVRILEGDTAGCAAIFHVDREGFVHLLYADVGSFGEVACVGSIDRHEGAFWGTLVWPGLSLEETPTLQVPLTFEQRKLDDTRPPSRILLRDAEGWTGPARRRRQERLRASPGFPQRHVLAVELAAIALLEGEGAEAQRGAYTQYATGPATPAERELWQITVAMIERGWLTEANAVETDATEAESSEDPVRPPPSATDVLQDAGDGQKAQKEEASDAR